MSASFTPGPWTAERHPTGWQIDASQDAVATTAFCYAREADANAHLIAAAPALYEALADTVRRVEYASGMYHNSLQWHQEEAPHVGGTLWDWVFAPAHAALALARGEHPTPPMMEA